PPPPLMSAMCEVQELAAKLVINNLGYAAGTWRGCCYPGEGERAYQRKVRRSSSSSSSNIRQNSFSSSVTGRLLRVRRSATTCLRCSICSGETGSLIPGSTASIGLFFAYPDINVPSLRPGQGYHVPPWRALHH